MDCLRDNLQENPDIWIYKTHGFRWRFSREKPIRWNGQLFFLESATWRSCSYQGLLCFAWCSLWAFGIPGWWAVQSVASPWKVPSPNPPGIVFGFAKGSIKDLHIWKDTQIEGGSSFFTPRPITCHSLQYIILANFWLKICKQHQQTVLSRLVGWHSYLFFGWPAVLGGLAFWWSPWSGPSAFRCWCVLLTSAWAWNLDTLLTSSKKA